MAGLVKVSAVVGAGIAVVAAKFSLHTSIHVLGFLMATVLVVISCNSYYRERSPKILLLTIAFAFLTLQQMMELSEAVQVFNFNATIPFLGIELVHTVSFATVAFLAAGVLKKR